MLDAVECLALVTLVPVFVLSGSIILLVGWRLAVWRLRVAELKALVEKEETDAER